MQGITPGGSGLGTEARPDGYGWTGLLLHWLSAVLVVGLFALGLWMVELGYYHPWYNLAPAVHELVGVLFGLVLVVRLGWRAAGGASPLEAGLGRWERRVALLVHAALYLLMAVAAVSGYLISTADGALDLFGWLRLPPLATGWANQEDVAGSVHQYSAWALVILAAAHALAALKHHFRDRDRTLRRMLVPHS